MFFRLTQCEPQNHSSPAFSSLFPTGAILVRLRIALIQSYDLGSASSTGGFSFRLRDRNSAWLPDHAYISMDPKALIRARILAQIDIYHVDILESKFQVHGTSSHLCHKPDRHLVSAQSLEPIPKQCGANALPLEQRKNHQMSPPYRRYHQPGSCRLRGRKYVDIERLTNVPLASHMLAMCCSHPAHDSFQEHCVGAFWEADS